MTGLFGELTDQYIVRNYIPVARAVFDKKEGLISAVAQFGDANR